MAKAPRASSPPTGIKTSAAIFTLGLACLAVFNLYWAASVEHETEVGAGGRYRPPQEPLPKAVDPLLRGLTVDAANVAPSIPVSAPAAAECKSAAVAAPPVAPPARVRKLSRQTTERCQQTADETEVCFYDGPICYDGERIVVFTDKPKGSDRRSSMCFDFRHYVSSYTCTYGDGFERPGLPADTTPEVLYDQTPGVGAYGSLANSWGPQGKEVQFREEHPSLLTRQGLIAANTSIYWLKAGALGTGWDGGSANEADLFTAARERGFMTPETLAARPPTAGADPDTLPDEGDLTSGLYVSSVHHSWIDHVWHGAAAFMALWDVKRYNRTRGGPLPGFTPSTVPSDRSDGDLEPWASDFVGLPPGPGNPIRPMGAWVAPPMDHLLIAGDYRTVTGLQAGNHNMMGWLRGMLRLVTSSHTRVLFNTHYKALDVAKNRLVCARRGVVTGYKPRIFSGIGDAHAYRLAAYRAVGIANRPANAWPPRTITIITRKHSTRGILNTLDLIMKLNATGMRVEWVTNMGRMSYEQQVALMANTGILICTHGAALANAMFLPAHAVVIEMFPYLLYASMYRDLAASAGLFYYSLRSLRPTPTQAPLLHEESFLRTCDGAKHFEDMVANMTEASTAAAHAAAGANTEDGMALIGGRYVPLTSLRHVSSSAAFHDYECNWRSKSSDMVLDVTEFGMVVAAALDDIGCRDGWCDMGGNRYARYDVGVISDGRPGIHL